MDRSRRRDDGLFECTKCGRTSKSQGYINGTHWSEAHGGGTGGQPAGDECPRGGRHSWRLLTQSERQMVHRDQKKTVDELGFREVCEKCQKLR